MKHVHKCLPLLASFLSVFICVKGDGCLFPDKKDVPAEDLKAYQHLKPLVGRRYRIEEGDYVYDIGICSDAIPGNPKSKDVGVMQTHKNDGSTTAVGKYSLSSIMAGTNWVLLQYQDGETYNTHCNKEPRKAWILFTCDPTASDQRPGPKMLEEDNGKDTDCYYLFELAHPEVCAITAASRSSLSVGSIVLIVFVCVAAVYLIAGGLYQRFVLGAKGMEQLPNYEFWKDFGNLQADGCDFLCRTREARNSSPYKGLGDDQLEEPEERDDNLLPM